MRCPEFCGWDLREESAKQIEIGFHMRVPNCVHCTVVSPWVPQKGEFLSVFRQKTEVGLVAKQGWECFGNF